MPRTTEIDGIEKTKCFDVFSNLKIVVDCPEQFSETPSSVGAHLQFNVTVRKPL